MTLHSIFSKLRKQNKGQYLILGFCISLSVLLITSYALMYLGPTVQDFLPQGGDTRKLASLLLAVTAVGCTIFTLYASSLFFRYKSREYGILLALGSPKKALRPLLFSELAFVTGFSALIGLILSVPVSFGIWKLFESFLLPTEDMAYRFGWTGFMVGIAFCIVLTLLLFLAGRRFLHRTDIMDILRSGQKTETVKEIPSWTRKLGIILTVSGIVLGLGVPSICAKLFYIHIPSIFNLIYFVALAGIYLIILSCVSQNSAGKRKDKYYSNLVSISMMRFTAKVTTKNMCVIVLLLFCCLFAAFFGMLYSDTTGISMDGNEKAYSFHFPAEEEQITKNDIEKLADEYQITLASYAENDAANLVISYRYRDMIDNKYVTLDAKNGKLALFFPESAYEEISGQDISVEPNTYQTITYKDYKEKIWEFTDGLYAVYNPDTGKTLQLSFGGTLEFDALSDMSSPFAYVLNDADYQAASASLGSQYMEKIICFDVKDTEHSYNFAKALQMEYVRHTSSLSDFQKRRIDKVMQPCGNKNPVQEGIDTDSRRPCPCKKCLQSTYSMLYLGPDQHRQKCNRNHDKESQYINKCGAFKYSQKFREFCVKIPVMEPDYNCRDHDRAQHSHIQGLNTSHAGKSCAAARVHSKIHTENRSPLCQNSIDKIVKGKIDHQRLQTGPRILFFSKPNRQSDHKY